MKLTSSTIESNKSYPLNVSYQHFYIPTMSLNVTSNDTDTLEWRHMGIQNSSLDSIIITRMTTQSRFVLTIGYQLNGLIKQWGLNKTKSNVHEITLGASYSNTDYTIMAMGQAKSEYANANVYGYAVSDNQIKLDTSQLNWKVYMYWFTIGYQLNGLLIQWGYHQENGVSGRTISFVPSFTEFPVMSITQLFNGSATNEEVIIKVVSSTSFTYDSYNNRNVFWYAIGYQQPIVNHEVV